MNSLELRRRIIENSPHVEIKSGTFVTFDTISEKLKGCKVYFYPQQDGTGMPSPLNVRPISGVDSLYIIRSSSLDDYYVDWSEPVGELYGGYYNALTGDLFMTHAFKELHGGEDEWSYDGGSRQVFVYSWNEVRGTGLTMCNMTEPSDITYGDSPSYPHVINTRDRNNIRTHVVNENMTIDSFFDWLSEHPLQIVCPLITPIRYQISSIDIKAQKGSNALWSNSDNKVEVKYWTY